MTITHSKLQAARENAFSALNRARKVIALCEAIPHGTTPEEVRRTADFFEALSEDWWKELADKVGVNLPSEITRKAVVNVLRSRTPVAQ